MEILPFLIDVAFLAVLVINFIDGRKRGFVRIVLSLIVTIASWLIASEYSQPVAVWANESFVHDLISGSIENAVASHLGSGTAALIEAIPDYVANAAELAGISIQNLASQLNTAVDSAQAAETVYNAIEASFVIPAIRIVAFFIIYAIANALLSVGIGVIDKIFKLPIIKSFNKLLGGVIGAVKGVFIIAVISLVFSLMMLLAPETQLSQAISESAIQKILTDVISTLFAN